MTNLSNSINKALEAGYNADEISAFLQNDERYKNEYASVLESAGNDAKLTFELLRSGKRLGGGNLGGGERIASLPRNDGDKAQSEFEMATSWLDEKQAGKYNTDDFYKARAENANSPRFAYDETSLNALARGENSEDLKAKQDYLNALKSPLKPVEDIIDSTTFGLSSLVADSLTNDDRAKGKDLFEKDLTRAKKQGVSYEDLDDDLKAHALERARDEKSILGNPIDTIKNVIDYFGNENLGKELYEKEQNLYNLSRKNYEELSEEEKAQIYKETSPFLSQFVNGKVGKEDFKDFKDYEFAKGVISEDIQEAINTLDIMHNSNNLLSLFNDDKELKKDYLQSAYNIAELSGFDDVALDKKGGLYFVKENERGEEAYYKINKGFIDNFKNSLNATKYEIAGSLAGYYIGALKDEGKNLFKAGAKNPFALKKKIPQRLIYSMFGAGAGAGVDYAVNNLALNREGNFEEGMKYLTQAMALDLVANKAGEALAQGIEKISKGEFQSLFEKPLNLINSALNNSPFVGFFKRSLGNFLDAQNISGAEKIAKEHFTKEQLSDLENALNAFGGSFKVVDERSEALKNADHFLKNKYGENSSFYKGYKGIERALSLESVKDRQGAIIDLIRADESGVNMQILAQVASQSTEANLALKQALSKASNKLKENLDRLITNKNELKVIFENYEKNTKQSYNEAVEKTIYEVLKGEKIQLDDGNFNKFLDELDKSGYVLENSHLNFIQSLKNNLYGKEISFENLHAVQKSLNANLKDIKDRNLKSFLQDKIESTLRADIEKGMQEFFKTKPSLYADLARTFEMASKDYATLKSTIKEAKKQRIYKEGEFKKNIQSIMLSYAKGSKQGIELEKLTAGLSKSEIKDIELSSLTSFLIRI